MDYPRKGFQLGTETHLTDWTKISGRERGCHKLKWGTTPFWVYLGEGRQCLQCAVSTFVTIGCYLMQVYHPRSVVACCNCEDVPVEWSFLLCGPGVIFNNVCEKNIFWGL